MLISTTSLLGNTESSQIECSTSSSFGSASVSSGSEAVVISARGQSRSSSGASSAVSDYGAAQAEACTIVYGGIGTIVPGLFVLLRQGIYYEIGDEQQSKVRNIVIDW